MTLVQSDMHTHESPLLKVESVFL